MNKEFDISEEYKKNQDIKDENKYLWIGITVMTIAAFLDWELFQWIYKLIRISH